MENSLADSLTAGSSAGKSELLERTLESENKADVKTRWPMSNRVQTFDRSLPPLCHPFQTAHHPSPLLSRLIRGFVERISLFESSYRARSTISLQAALLFLPFLFPIFPSLSTHPLSSTEPYAYIFVDKSIHFSRMRKTSFLLRECRVFISVDIYYIFCV